MIVYYTVCFLIFLFSRFFSCFLAFSRFLDLYVSIFREDRLEPSERLRSQALSAANFATQKFAHVHASREQVVGERAQEGKKETKNHAKGVDIINSAGIAYHQPTGLYIIKTKFCMLSIRREMHAGA